MKKSRDKRNDKDNDRGRDKNKSKGDIKSRWCLRRMLSSEAALKEVPYAMFRAANPIRMPVKSRHRHQNKITTITVLHSTIRQTMARIQDKARVKRKIHGWEVRRDEVSMDKNTTNMRNKKCSIEHIQLPRT